MHSKLLVLLTVAVVMAIAPIAARQAPARAATTVVLYGTTGAGNNLSSLYRIDPATGAGTLIGPTGFRGVSGIDFHPQTGVLYGIGRRQADDIPVLIRINTTTGVATEVGPTMAPAGFRFPDLAFRQSDAALFAWSFPPERLASINVATGAANIFGAPQPSGAGDALAFDYNGTLFHTIGASLGTVNPATGVFTLIAPIVLVPPGIVSIGAMKFHPQSGALYGVNVISSVNSTLTLIDPVTAVVTTIGSTVQGLDSIAFQPASPTVSKTFAANSIAAGTTTTLSFTLTNPNLAALSGVGFTDQLPAGLVVATPNGLSGTCGGGSISAAAGGSTITLANGSLGRLASCSFSVSVLATTTGTKTNTTGSVSAAQSGPGGTAVATLTVTEEIVAPKVPSPIPQVFQNPGAIAIVSSRPGGAPTPGRPSAAAPASAAVTTMPVLRPPSTGDAGLKLD